MVHPFGIQHHSCRLQRCLDIHYRFPCCRREERSTLHTSLRYSSCSTLWEAVSFASLPPVLSYCHSLRSTRSFEIHMQRLALPFWSEPACSTLYRHLPVEVDLVRVLCSQFVQSVWLHRPPMLGGVVRCEPVALHCRVTLHVRG